MFYVFNFSNRHSSGLLHPQSVISNCLIPWSMRWLSWWSDTSWNIYKIRDLILNFQNVPLLRLITRLVPPSKLQGDHISYPKIYRGHVVLCLIVSMVPLSLRGKFLTLSLPNLTTLSAPKASTVNLQVTAVGTLVALYPRLTQKRVYQPSTLPITLSWPLTQGGVYVSTRKTCRVGKITFI